MERVQAAHYDNNHDSAALLRLLISGCTTHHTQLHTKHTHKKKRRKKTSKKKRKEKKGSKRKLSMPVLNNGKSEKNMVLINLQLIFINKN